MITHYFKGELLSKARSNWLFSVLEKMATFYLEKDYDRSYARCCLIGGLKFGAWLRCSHIPVRDVDKTISKKYFEFFTNSRNGKHRRLSHREKSGVLLATQIIEDLSINTIPHKADIEMRLDEYAEYLSRVRGLTVGTINNHVRYLRPFMRKILSHSIVDISLVDTGFIRDYIVGLSNCKTTQTKSCTVLRGYFKFLEVNEKCSAQLYYAVPRVATMRSSLSPNVLGKGAIDQLLASIDRTSPKGKRDYASALCLIDLGLRVGDVAVLTIDDIDWKKGEIRIPNSKTKMSFNLPISKRLGEALTDYIKNGRGKHSSRVVFFQHKKHLTGSPVTSGTIRSAISVYFHKIGSRRMGTHQLRHSLATNLCRGGISLKTLADILGHKSIETTRLYAQLDINTLKSIMQKWPEVQHE
ncbi:MAG: tyrosine-type recombinase/integrase [Victivallales bacterium]|nr:tyrosine-type recombinase/integrase [Victivallales bacterium]